MFPVKCIRGCSGRKLIDDCVCVTTLTFAVAGVVPQHRTFFDRPERLEQQPHVVLILLLVQHPDKQLPIFYKPHHSRAA